MTKSSPTKAFFRHYWLPLLSCVLLILLCTDSNPVDGRAMAKLFSGPIYKSYIAISVALFLGLAWKRRSFVTIRHAVELILSTLILTNVLKYATGLPRPPRLHGGVWDPNAFSPGFPSAHTAFACGLAWLVWEINPRLAIPWFGIAVAIGWSRVELNAHYPYQVWCGALLGVALGYLISHSKNGLLSTLSGLRKKYSSPLLTTKAQAVACFAQICDFLSMG